MHEEKIVVQIAPSPEQLPEGMEWRLLSVRDNESPKIVDCRVCGGNGKLKYESCRLCDGVGRYPGYIATRIIVIPGKEAEQVANFVKSLPKEKGFKISTRLMLHEEGSGYTNTGQVTVICALDGGKLRSIGGLPRVNEPHAIFLAYCGLRIKYGRHHCDGNGTVHLLQVNEDHTTIRKELLYEFNNNLEFVAKSSHEVKFPMEAARAAIDKSYIYHCRSAVWAEGKYASGSSGPKAGWRKF